MPKNNQLRIAVVISYLTLGISTVIPFFYTPVMLRLLGSAEYGLYSLSNSVIHYLSLLSFGFGGTIVRYITMYRARGEKEKLENAFALFLIIYCIFASFVMIGGVVLSFSVEVIFHKGLTASEISKMRVLMLIMAFNTAISFPISAFSAVIISHERYIYRKLMDMILTIAGPIISIIMLYIGFASVGMALTSTITQTIVLPINMFYCFHVLDVRPKYGHIEKAIIKEMMGFSAFTFLGTIVDMLFWTTDKVILGMLTSTVVVAVYNIGSTFNSMLISFSTAISDVLVPKVTTMVAKEASKDKITELFIKVGRLQFIIVSLAVSGFAVFGQEFVTLWAGEQYSDAYSIALLTLVPLSIPLIENTGLAFVVAQNKHKFRSLVYLAIAIANVISTYLIVPYLGAIGAALCSAISYIVGQGIIMNAYYYYKVGIDIPLFWKNIIKMAIVPVVLMILGFLIKRRVSYNNWGTFLCGVIVYTMLFGVLMFTLEMNQYEKDIFIRPMRKVLKRD